MQKSVNYTICGNRTNRSEVVLFRHEKITAGRCMVVKAPVGLRHVHLVENARGGLTAWAIRSAR
jgi:hypothetical protein